MSETPTKTVTRVIRRRPRLESIGGIPTRYLQTGMILVSLVLSGVVAWKVFFPKKQPQIQQQLPQYQQQQPLPEELVQEPMIYQHPNIPAFQNGNGHSNSNGQMYDMQKGPAMSSHAEKMIMDESLKKVPMYYDTGMSNIQQQQPSVPVQAYNQSRENVPIYQYRVPAAPQLGQQPGQQQTRVQGSDIF
jgi:hypothetical protein